MWRAPIGDGLPSHGSRQRQRTCLYLPARACCQPGADLPPSGSLLPPPTLGWLAFATPGTFVWLGF